MGPLSRLLRQFNNPLNIALVVAAVITGPLQHWVETAVILAVATDQRSGVGFAYLVGGILVIADTFLIQQGVQLAR